MKNISQTFFAVAAMALVLSSCKKDIVEDPNKTEYNSDIEQFEAVWNGLNTAYVLWSIDTTNWDLVYEKYHPIFENMEDETDEKWQSTWKELTSTLIDHHLKICLERPSTKAKITLTPCIDELMSRNYFHLPTYTVSKLLMLVKLELEGRLKDVKTTNETDKLLCSGILDDEIAYIFISSFDNILIDTIDAFQHFKRLVADGNTKSAIIDLRGNQGGIAQNTDYLLSCFSGKSLQIGSNRTKTGLGRYELGPEVPYYVGAGVFINDEILIGQDRDIPVVILCDLFSASAAEIATIAIKQLPHSYMVGERTLGATCALYNDFGMFYSGSFGDMQINGYNQWIGHGHCIYTPKYLFAGIDGTVYEGHGIDPDVECLFDQSAWNNGTDNQLEGAVEFAKKKIAEKAN